jgi:RHS repeat-associated protein
VGLDIGFDAQTPSLPEGGGAVFGLGETFSPDLSTGTGSFSIPFDCPNGPNDIWPRLSLRYDSSSGNGPFGLGVSIPLPRILRSTARGFPAYAASDELLLEGAGPLVDVGAGSYRLQVDGRAWQIDASGDGFRLTARDGNFYFLGTSAQSRLINPASGAVYAWHLERIEDPLGYAADFVWQRSGSQLYLASAAYGTYEVHLAYSKRPDIVRNGRAGFLITTGLRCDTVELHMPSDPQPLLRRWSLSYTQAEGNNASLLSEVALTGFESDLSSVDGQPLRLSYASFSPRTLERLQNQDDSAPPPPLDQPFRQTELIDWTGDGRADLIELTPGSARVWPNIGELTWGRPRIIPDVSGLFAGQSAVAFADMNGDGFADIVRLDNRLSGYVPRKPGGGFEQPVTWRQAPSALAASPDARMMDLDGDGIVDLIHTGADWVSLYLREDADGWAEQPQLVSQAAFPEVRLSDPRVFVADMNGDGSDDLVRVAGDGVTYWPYLGLGRWGEPVAMENPPLLPFDVVPSRILLTDVDGDGCADVVYVNDGRVLVWVNQTGNGFADPRTIDFVPGGSLQQMRLADMRGSGTAGLLWSMRVPARTGTPYFFLDFTGGSKPYLLTGIDNGCGLLTSIEYSTSAEASSIDARLGEPWSTLLPVVVPVVSRLVTTDTTSGQTSTTEYRYHDGRYDGVLREFAGFGRVDMDELGDETAPTLRTTTWFHIGVDPANPGGPLPIEERRRLRASRGRVYRKERFGLDGSPQSSQPYDRLEQTWSVATEQTAGGTVYLPRLTGTTNWIIEREPAPVAAVVTTDTAWDAAGNVVDRTETSTVVGEPQPKRVLRTVSAFASDPKGRFLSRPWRVQQFDDTGVVLADCVTEYDGQPAGSVGSLGLITRRTALALRDDMLPAAYGADVPDFAALGYFRSPLSSGWWAELASYQRTTDAAGLHGRVTSPRGASSTFDFDAHQTFPTRMVDAAGNTITAEYDYRLNRVQRVVDASGQEHLSRYDALARLTSTVEPDDTPALPTVGYSYMPASLPMKLVRQQRADSGAASTIDQTTFLDGAGRTLERRAQDDSGDISVVAYQYCARGLVARMFLEHRPLQADYQPTDPGQPHVVYRYDALGRVVEEQHPDGSVRRVVHGPMSIEEWDAEDTRTDAGAIHAGTPTLHILDPEGHVVRIQENLQGRAIVSTYTYDAKGQLQSHTDALGRIVRMSSDLLGHSLLVDHPERTSVAVVDPAGNTVETRTRDGSKVEYVFDALNRPTEVRTGGASTIRFAYHDSGAAAPPDAGLHTSGGRCVRVDDEGGTTVFDYDARGRPASRRYAPLLNPATYRIDFVHRSDGQLKQITYPDTGAGRRIITYEYDKRGQLVRIPSLVSSITYDVAGNRESTTFANGVGENRVHDPLTHLLISLDIGGPAGSAWSAGFHFDRAANLIGLDSPNPKLAAAYTHDDLYRLIGVQSVSGETWAYDYDDTGALTHKSDVGDYRYGEAGAPASCLTSAGASTFTYTAHGQMQTAPWGTHTYDSLGRLTMLNFAAGGALSYTYDYQGRRVSARSSGPAQAIDRLTPDTLFAIEQGSLVLHFWDGQRIVAQESAAGVRVYLHADHAGDVVLVTDAAGTTVDTLRYAPYGQVLERMVAGPEVPFGFVGGTLDAGGDLLYLGARYYIPHLGVFLTPDPVVGQVLVPIDWTSYVYARSNPVSFADPSGMRSQAWNRVLSIFAVAALAIVTIVAAIVAPELLPAIIYGAVAGGVISGISGYLHGAKGGDLAASVLVGAAVGGWAAFLGAEAASMVIPDPNLAEAHTLFKDVLAGALNGAPNGAAMGFASGFADPRETGGEIALRAFWSMLIGAGVGGGLGALSHLTISRPSSVSQPESIPNGRPPTEAQPTWSLKGTPPADAPPGARTPIWDVPQTRSANPTGLLPDAGSKALQQSSLQIGQSPQVTVPLFGKPIFQTIVVDLALGSGNLADKQVLWLMRQIGEIKL